MCLAVCLLLRSIMQYQNTLFLQNLMKKVSHFPQHIFPYKSSHTRLRCARCEIVSYCAVCKSLLYLSHGSFPKNTHTSYLEKCHENTYLEQAQLNTTAAHTKWHIFCPNFCSTSSLHIKRNFAKHFAVYSLNGYRYSAVQRKEMRQWNILMQPRRYTKVSRGL